MKENYVNWWKTPPESPDLNLGHELKEYIRRVVKPTVKQELVDGMRAFWETVSDAERCMKCVFMCVCVCK